MVKKRCEFEGCSKKLDLTAFPCKCCKTFCPTHRSDVVHNCTYDYKSEHKSTLTKFMSSPVIAAKVELI